MSNRQRFIRPAVIARPVLVAAALRHVATMLDAGDDERKTTFFSALGTEAATRESQAAWSQTALLIADEFDCDSVKLRAIAATLDKGVQDELPT